MKIEIARHWTRVAELGCIVTGGPATIHHVHGGSCRFHGIHKGLGQKTSDWLVIPLCAELHYLPPDGIDCGRISVIEWETRYGTQVEHLLEVSRRLGYDVIEKAGLR